MSLSLPVEPPAEVPAASRARRSPRAWVVRWVSPLVWRVPGHAARKLHAFAGAEHGSMLELRAAARLSPSPQRQALYLRHALDEARHAAMFARRSALLREQEGREGLGHPSAQAEALYETLGEVGFVAHVHRAERHGREQFEVYADVFGRRGDAQTRAMFEGILADERRHESYSWALLVELAGGEAGARRALARVAGWNAWRAWRRVGRAGGNHLYGVLMLGLYLASAPLALLTRALRPVPRGWKLPR